MRMTVDDLLIEARGVLPHHPGPAEALAAQAAGRCGGVWGGHHGGWRARLPGRADELHRPGRVGARGRGLLDQCRLVTVTGPGGSGKTRLAGEVARRVAGRFADGRGWRNWRRWLTRSMCRRRWPRRWGCGSSRGCRRPRRWCGCWPGQQLLLVLDNCEHVTGAAALCARLLPACDDVRVLATSREPLRAGGEARYRLAPLTLPDPDDAADVGGSEAVTLFADRARRVDAGSCWMGRPVR